MTRVGVLAARGAITRSLAGALRGATLSAAFATGCRPAQTPPMASFPAQASLECFVPTPEDYAVTIVVPDTTFRDSAWLRPILGDIGRHWPVSLPLPRHAVDIAFTFHRDGTSSKPRRGNPQPDFPRERQRGEQVIAGFTVDSLGNVDPSSIAIVSATNDDFANAVVNVLPQWKCTPSPVRGCRVARAIRWEFGEMP